MPVIGMTRSSPVDCLAIADRLRTPLQVPLAEQFLGASRAGRAHKRGQIPRTIHIVGYARQPQHDHGFADTARGRQMRSETVIAKSQWKKSRRRTQDGIRATAILSWDKHRTFAGCRMQNGV